MAVTKCAKKLRKKNYGSLRLDTILLNFLMEFQPCILGNRLHIEF